MGGIKEWKFEHIWVEHCCGSLSRFWASNWFEWSAAVVASAGFVLQYVATSFISKIITDSTQIGKVKWGNFHLPIVNH